MATGELLPPAVLRQIGDKLYEKRKLAALEVEQIIKRLAAANDQHRCDSGGRRKSCKGSRDSQNVNALPLRIRLVLDKIISDFSFSAVANSRKVRRRCPERAGGASAVANTHVTEARSTVVHQRASLLGLLPRCMRCGMQLPTQESSAPRAPNAPCPARLYGFVQHFGINPT